MLEAAVDGLGDGRLHQVDVAHHQRDKQVLQVFVERPVAKVSCKSGVNRGQAGQVLSDWYFRAGVFNLF